VRGQVSTGFKAGARVQGPGSRVQGPGSRVQGPGSRVQGPGSRVHGPGSRVHGLGSSARGMGFGGCGLEAARGRANLLTDLLIHVLHPLHDEVHHFVHHHLLLARVHHRRGSSFGVSGF